ncbi:class I SAM-dependent methyltransferase [Sphaerisporangium album]|uniref:Class I SAM-dependent methyltransferase n=1 Tax=Sphaerisporangium album TaxID=509200 RepID=A0A367FDI7_9ACTN|nr:class I SAM-dependent methyltransferase [Sphaerisporangium album]RCG28351.1 class I SAM-dependent methyltransferase [Sphaerisporangium album]
MAGGADPHDGEDVGGGVATSAGSVRATVWGGDVAGDGDRLRRRWSFDADPDGYHAARPGYPSAVLERLRDVCGLAEGRRVLEIGPGTGQATNELLGAGAQVVAVELGSHLAGYLRARFQGRPLTVIEADFDTVTPAEAGFDLAVAATSLHWLDLAVALPKIGRALLPGAWLAAWWTVYRDADPERETPFRRSLEAVFRRHRLGRGGGGMPGALDHDAWLAEFAGAGMFDDVRVEDIRWSVPFDSRGLTALFATFTEVTDLPEAERAALLGDIATLVDVEFGGEVVENYVTVLYLARRKAG